MGSSWREPLPAVVSSSLPSLTRVKGDAPSASKGNLAREAAVRYLKALRLANGEEEEDGSDDDGGDSGSEAAGGAADGEGTLVRRLGRMLRKAKRRKAKGVKKVKKRRKGKNGTVSSPSRRRD